MWTYGAVIEWATLYLSLLTDDVIERYTLNIFIDMDWIPFLLSMKSIRKWIVGLCASFLVRHNKWMDLSYLHSSCHCRRRGCYLSRFCHGDETQISRVLYLEIFIRPIHSPSCRFEYTSVWVPVDYWVSSFCRNSCGEGCLPALLKINVYRQHSLRLCESKENEFPKLIC